MSPLLVAMAIAAGVADIPEGMARYRVEIAGMPVGVAELSVSCHGSSGCRLSWESRLKLPAASGGVVRSRHIAARVRRGGELEGRVELAVDGARRTVRGRPETVPLALAELALVARGGGCLEVLDEETGRIGTACATLRAQGQPDEAAPARQRAPEAERSFAAGSDLERAGGLGERRLPSRSETGEPSTPPVQMPGARMRVDALGVIEEVTAGRDGFPEAVEIPAQRTRFVRDAAAEVPGAAPPLEVRVPGPPAGRAPHRFCGRAPDAPAPRADLSAFPVPRPDGSSCREQARAYAAALRARGLPARVAVGVAHDGAGFVWHAWTEARTAAGWVAVDPAFGELPARGPRFTIARHGGDVAGLAQAGRRVLECWGKSSVE